MKESLEDLRVNWEAAVADVESSFDGSAEALTILEALSRALFPGGAPDLAGMTWPETQGAHHDIHDAEARARAKLESAEKRFSTLINQIPAVTFMAVLGEGENEVYISPHIEQMLGFTQEEWLEDPFKWYWQLHEDDRALWNQEFARGCQTGGPFRAECRFYARDGSIKWVHGEARIVKDDLGRPQFLQGVAFDITEQKNAEDVLRQQAVASARLDEQLAIARRVQTSILPRDLGVSGLTIAYGMDPAEEVGGDYVDVHRTADGAWIGVGDVSGHGINAGMAMLMLQSAMAACCRTDPGARPSDMVRHLNHVLYDNIRERMERSDYVTFVVMHYTDDGKICYAGAHLSLLIRRKATGKVDVVHTRGGWLGAFPELDDAVFDDELTLADGDLLVLYTDGVTEAMDADRQQFGLDRLEALVAAADHHDPERTKDSIFAAVNDWMVERTDDVTVVALRYDTPKR